MTTLETLAQKSRQQV